ncbi:MAG: hypothetical protein K2X74_02415 [Acetobacteraceae bacterium]|nr:hypothetical protein [Acetobacteraceae bacterium]
MTPRVLLPLLLALAPTAALAQPDPTSWPPLGPRFESTGGGGIIIDEYRPVVIGDRCVTRFTATTPQGQVFTNYAVFEATPLAGGTLCSAGRFGAVDGSATGTTPLVVWLKDGRMHRRPDAE